MLLWQGSDPGGFENLRATKMDKQSECRVYLWDGQQVMLWYHWLHHIGNSSLEKEDIICRSQQKNYHSFATLTQNSTTITHSLFIKDCRNRPHGESVHSLPEVSVVEQFQLPRSASVDKSLVYYNAIIFRWTYAGE